MKLVYGSFFCPRCGQLKYLKSGNICVDCKDKQVLDEISRSRKNNRENLLLNLV